MKAIPVSVELSRVNSSPEGKLGIPQSLCGACCTRASTGARAALEGAGCVGPFASEALLSVAWSPYAGASLTHQLVFMSEVICQGREIFLPSFLPVAFFVCLFF